MPHSTENHNQNNDHKQITDLNLFDFKIRTMGGRLRISSHHFADMFDLSRALVGGLLVEWMQKPGQRDTVWACESDAVTGDLWADATAALILVDHFRIRPVIAEKLLTDLGFYRYTAGVAA